MPPIPQDTTPRYLVRYTSGGLPHTLQVRLLQSELPAEVQDYLDNLVTNMLPIMAPTDSVQAIDFIPQGSNISQPYSTAMTGVGTAQGTVNNAENRTCFLSATGKDANGVQVRCTIFCLIAGNFVEYRQPIGVTNPLFANWWDAVQASQNASSVTVGGDIPFWKTYLNIGQNSHFQRKQR